MTDVKKDHRLEDIMMYAEGALTPEETAELEEHMRGCAECQASLETVKAFLPAVQKALTPKKQSSEELLAWAMAKMEEEERQGQGAKVIPFRRARVVLAGFAVAAAAAAVFLAVRTQQIGPNTVVRAGEDAGEGSGIVAAPRPPGWEKRRRSDGGQDAGVDAGVPSP